MVESEEPLTHLDEEGRARMVDVGHKAETARCATALGRVTVAAATLRRILGGDVAKGDVIATARLAGIQAAKQTSGLIPLCHPIRLTSVDVGITPEGEDALRIRAVTRAFDRTGVEMEALTAVAVAALTIYDMVKAIDRNAAIGDIHLVAKSGGRSGDWRREEA